MERPRLDTFYLTVVLVLMVIGPGASVAIELARGDGALPVIATIGKWFAFWAVGVRLFTAGVRQVLNPAFTARAIFHATSDDSVPIVRELGFANICLGLIGVISLWLPAWRLAGACAGGLYFAIAGVQHVIKKPAGPNEVVAMLSDLFIAAVMAVYIFS